MQRLVNIIFAYETLNEKASICNEVVSQHFDILGFESVEDGAEIAQSACVRKITKQRIGPMDWAALAKSSNAKIARIIHAMELTPDMKRQLRRRRR